MSIKGAIFDLDGTLFDSMLLWDDIGEAYLRSIGYEPRENLAETFKEMSLYQAACYYQTEYGVSLTTDEIMNGVNAMVENYYREVVSLKPGVADFLKHLQEQGVKMCITTAADCWVEVALERLCIREYFSAIFTCTSVGHGKDEPVIYREALKHLQTKKAETIIFEDAFYAVKTAKEDGFITVAIYDSHEKNQSEIKAYADFYMKDFLDFNVFWNFASEI